MDDLISRQAAIDAIKAYWKKVVDDIPEDAGFEEVIRLCDLALEHNAGILKTVNNLPSAQSEIIRCKDCKYAQLTYDGDCKFCLKVTDDYDIPMTVYYSGNHYCGFAERRTDE